MSKITEFQLQTILDEAFSTESFVTFEPGGKVMYNDDSVGAWEDLGNTRKVALFIKEDENDMEIFHVIKDVPVANKDKKEKDMDNGKTECACLTSKGAQCKNNATHERDGKMVCGPHMKAKNVTFKGYDKITPLARPTEEQVDEFMKNMVDLDGNMDQGAMNNPENTKRGVAKVKSALENNKKEKVMKMGISVEEAKKVSEMVDINKVQQFANELYGTNYGMGQTYIKVGANSGQALDNSRPGHIHCGSEYVGSVHTDGKEFYICFDRGDHNENINISKFLKEKSNMDSNTQVKDSPVLNADVFFCNIWSKGGKTIYYFTQEWKNVERTRDDLVARAEAALGNKQNKAIVMLIDSKWVVITKVVKDGQLVTKSVFSENMDLRKNNR